jgi:cyclopropane fatty-acyl-phospholipid synthase-like methyltransferase
MDSAQLSELEHHEELYSGFAQEHFSKPGVRAFRRHLVRRMQRRLGIGKHSRVLSLGCGIGDTELLLAPNCREVVGIDLSPKGIAEAKRQAQSAGISNAFFAVRSWESVEALGSFDYVIAIFFLHHLTPQQIRVLAGKMKSVLNPGGNFYALDPSRYRLSGLIGSLVIPHLMRRYQTEGEAPLRSGDVTDAFRQQGFRVRRHWYDFGSTPIAGLFPSSEAAYAVARTVDNLLIRIPGINLLSSNFEVVARPR